MHLIVGIDPGTKTGIAVLNFDGKLIDLFSSKNLGLNRTIEHLISLGKVSLIATDVNPVPNFVSRIATKLGSSLFVPEESLHVNEKIELTRAYKTKDSHQRDALAAALIAFSKFKNKFRKMDSLELGDDAKHLVVHGFSIESAIKELQKEEKPKAIEKAKKKQIKERALSEEEKQIRRLEKQNSVLKREIPIKEEEIERLKKKISSIRRSYKIKLKKEPEIRKRDHIIRSLEASITELNARLGDIERLRNLWQKLIRGKIIPVAIFPENSKLVWIKGKLKRHDLDKLDGVEVAFTDNPRDREHLSRMGIITADPKHLSEISDCVYINSQDLKRIMLSKEISLDEIIRSYRSERGSSHTLN